MRKIPNTQAFVEEKKDIARSALSNAISLYLSSTTPATSDTVTTDDATEVNAVATVTTDVANEDADADADSSPAVESQSVADADAPSSDSDSDTDSTTSDSDSD